MRLFDREFKRNKNDSEEWGATASNLHMAADVVFEAYGQSWNLDGEPEHPEYKDLDAAATMLYGCAMENMIKGYLIKKHGGFEQARAANQIAWDRHQLPRLAEVGHTSWPRGRCGRPWKPPARAAAAPVPSASHPGTRSASPGPNPPGRPARPAWRTRARPGPCPVRATPRGP